MKVHFIGIGGIGVSALARYYLFQGHEVSGSDLTSSEITCALSKLGAKIFIGKHKTTNLPKDAGVVVYSPAVQKFNPELKSAFKIQNSKFKIKILSYPQALGDLTKNHFTIAVCGSHGKSTTTAMLGIILTKAGFDPTVIVGTKVKEFGESNYRAGKSKYLVIEADEHFKSFLNYLPKIIILTSLGKDHLDYYKTFKNYVSAFGKFILNLPRNGVLVINKDDKNIRKLKSKLKTENGKPQLKIQNYSLRQVEAKKIKKLLKIPGEFNVSNALAALSAARAMKIPDTISFKALAGYKGSWRRFEERDLKIKSLNRRTKLKIISDYAHHPTQVELTLNAARQKFPGKKIWCIFQPHQYQRTYYLFDDFVKAFSRAPVDKLIITDIYEVAGRENKEIRNKVNSKKLVKRIKNLKFKIKNFILYISTIQGVGEYLKRNLMGGEVVIIMGAGDIYKLPERLKTEP